MGRVIIFTMALIYGGLQVGVDWNKASETVTKLEKVINSTTQQISDKVHNAQVENSFKMWQTVTLLNTDYLQSSIKARNVTKTTSEGITDYIGAELDRYKALAIQMIVPLSADQKKTIEDISLKGEKDIKDLGSQLASYLPD